MWHDCWCQVDRLFCVFQELLMYWDFHTQLPLGFTENDTWWRKYPVRVLFWVKCLADPTGQRRMARLRTEIVNWGYNLYLLTNRRSIEDWKNCLVLLTLNFFHNIWLVGQNLWWTTWKIVPSCTYQLFRLLLM